MERARVGFKLKKQQLIDVDTRYLYDAKKVRFSFALTKNRPLLELRKEGGTAKLYHQRKYQTDFDDYGSVDERAQKPDMATEIFEEDEAIPEIVIVDPKYRIAEDRPPQSVIEYLSHYRNTIRDTRGRWIIKNVHIVYPGRFTESLGKRRDYGHIGLTPSSDMARFEQRILEMVS